MQKLYLKILLLILVMVALSSCYSYRNTGLLQTDNRQLPVYPKVDFVDYKIQVNDEIVYRLMTTDETISRLISTNAGASMQNINTYRVYPDGTIDIPFIKRIAVEGLTYEQASKVVEDRFKELIPDANVKVSIMNKRFTVIGEAGTGTYSIPRDRFTIYQALSMSGNLNQSADFKRIRILRETVSGVTKVLEFDIRPESIIHSEFYYIYPNDIIYVQRDKSSFYKVNNWSGLMGMVSTSLSLLFTVLYYNKL